MDCLGTEQSGTFGTCSQLINAEDFNKDSVIWYIEKEDTVYNFNLTLFPFLSTTPIKIVYPRIDNYNLKTLNKKRSFPIVDVSDPQVLPSLMPFSLGSTDLELNIQKTDEPVISFDRINNIFDLSFIGRLPIGLEGVCVFNYRFKKNGQILNPYSINAYTPSYNTWGTSFGDGYFSPYVNLQTYPKSTGLYVFPLSVDGQPYPCNYHPPCQDITAIHALDRGSLKFNSTSIDTLSTFGNNVTFFNYVSTFDPAQQIIVTFDLAAYYFVGEEYLCTDHSNTVCNTRTVSSYNPTGVGEGFCVYFHTLSSYKDFIGSGPGTCLGYSPASAVTVDEYDGLLVNFSQGLYGGHLGLGFDIGGDFHTTAEGKTGEGNTSPNSITLRSSSNDDHRLLYTRNLSATGLTLAQPVTSYDDIQFNTYRVILDNNARRIRAGIVDCTTNDFIDLLCYQASFTDSCDLNPNVITPGMSFSTGSRACHFELRSINMQGFYKTPSDSSCILPHIPTPTPTCPENFLFTPTPTITPTITPTNTPTSTITPTPTPSVTPSETPSPTPTSTVTPTPTRDPAASPTPTPTTTPDPSVTPTNTPDPSVTPTNTPDPTVTPTNTPDPTPTPTNSPDPTPTPSNTPDPTPSNTPDPTPSNTPDPTPSNTPDPTVTPTPTPSVNQGGEGSGIWYVKIGMLNSIAECGMLGWFDTPVNYLNVDPNSTGYESIWLDKMIAKQQTSLNYTETKYFVMAVMNDDFLFARPNNSSPAVWENPFTFGHENHQLFNRNGRAELPPGSGNFLIEYDSIEYLETGICGSEGALIDGVEYPVIDAPEPNPTFSEEVQAACCYGLESSTQNITLKEISQKCYIQWANLGEPGVPAGTYSDPFIITITQS